MKATLSARARADVLWSTGDTRSDAELAADLGVATRTVCDYRQQWNRANGRRNNRKLPAEVEVAILEMRNGGMSFPAIAEVVAEDFGYSITAKLAGEYYRRNADGLPTPVAVGEADLPLMTFAGLCWSVAVEPPRPHDRRWRKQWADFCDFCPHQEECYVAGCVYQFVKCEKPLQFELMEQ